MYLRVCCLQLHGKVCAFRDLYLDRQSSETPHTRNLPAIQFTLVKVIHHMCVASFGRRRKWCLESMNDAIVVGCSCKHLCNSVLSESYNQDARMAVV